MTQETNRLAWSKNWAERVLQPALPLAAELYWLFKRADQPADGGYSLEEVRQCLPGWRDDVLEARRSLAAQDGATPRHIALFGIQPYWVQVQMLIGLALAGLGHKVTLAYLPYGKYMRPAKHFDLLRQDVYMRKALAGANPLVELVSLFAQHPQPLPTELAEKIKDLTWRDTQYIQQTEDVSVDSDMYCLRHERNTRAAAVTLAWLEKTRPDVFIIPNGAILEFEAVYHAARWREVNTVNYEYSELSQRIWLAKNADVMRQDMDALWHSRQNTPLTEVQWEAIRTMSAARKRPQLWENFVFRYQGAASEGAQKLRAALGLDERPLALLATNVLGDSVTLGRQLFSATMGEWIERTVKYFAARPDLQLVIRIHPGELMLYGPSLAEIVHRALPDPPQHVHLIPADAKVNTYDIIEAADLGLVYTTTAGLEMAMTGVPAVVAGAAHYRRRGFTLDPQSWDEYWALLDRLPAALPEYRLRREQVELAWNYAYRYFFEFPHSFPWHLYNIQNDLAEWPLKRVLSPAGLEKFGATLNYLSGEPVILAGSEN